MSVGFVSGSIAPLSVPPGGSFTVSCDYGPQAFYTRSVATNLQTAPSATVGTCSYSTWNGNAAIFDCTAGSMLGSYPLRCSLLGVAPQDFCARTDDIGQLGIALAAATTSSSTTGGTSSAGATSGGTSSGSAYQTRVDFGARLEPAGNRILHGYGQYQGAAATSYPSALPGSEQPAMTMEYSGLADDLASNISSWESSSSQGSMGPLLASGAVVLQLGLYMFDPTTSAAYDCDVAAGKYATQIAAVVQALAAAGNPVYVRIGYEFNGSWNGYTPSCYVTAFQLIAGAIQAAGLSNVATVWCFSDGGDHNYMQYYPGLLRRLVGHGHVPELDVHRLDPASVPGGRRDPREASDDR